MNREYLGKDALPPGTIFPKTVETWRTKVSGGWLVLTTMSIGSDSTHSTGFFPDPAYEWDGATV